MNRPFSDTASAAADPSAPAALAARLRAHWLALAPALQTLRSAPARHAVLDAQLQRMLALQGEAERLKGVPRADPDNAARALQSAATERLGSTARTTVLGDRATVTLTGAPAGALAPWLAQVRSNAKSVPQEVHLVRATAPPVSAAAPVLATAPAAPVAAAAAPATARWDGTLVLALPPR